MEKVKDISTVKTFFCETLFYLYRAICVLSSHHIKCVFSLWVEVTSTLNNTTFDCDPPTQRWESMEVVEEWNAQDPAGQSVLFCQFVMAQGVDLVLPSPLSHLPPGWATAFFSTVGHVTTFQRKWQEQHLGASSDTCCIKLIPTHVQSTKGSPHPILLLFSVVFPGWLCGREPACQACFHAVRKQEPVLQSNLKLPRSHPLLFRILSSGGLRPLSMSPQVPPPQGILMLGPLLPPVHCLFWLLPLPVIIGNLRPQPAGKFIAKQLHCWNPDKSTLVNGSENMEDVWVTKPVRCHGVGLQRHTCRTYLLSWEFFIFHFS